MPSDQAQQVQTAEAPKWVLPAIKDVKIRAASYAPRAPKNFKHPMAVVKNAVEIVVSLSEPVPARAMSPVLWVGGHQLTESEVVDKTGKKMRFWSFDPAKLQSGASITMSWMNEPPAATRAKAKFSYKPPK